MIEVAVALHMTDDEASTELEVLATLSSRLTVIRVDTLPLLVDTAVIVVYLVVVEVLLRVVLMDWLLLEAELTTSLANCTPVEAYEEVRLL